MRKVGTVVAMVCWLLTLGMSNGTPVAAKASPAAQPEITVQDGVKHFGPAWLSKHDGVYFLYVEGTDYEMGYQHGVLLRDEIQAGMLPYMEGYFRREMEQSVIGGSPTLVKLAQGFMNKTVFDPIARNMPKDLEQGLRGLADGAGLSDPGMSRLVVFADAAQTIEGLVYGKARLFPGFTPPQAGTGMGCTSFCASGPATANGHLLHGRNLDFPGMGYFDQFPTVVFCRPQTGQRYVMFTSAGLHTAGATGLNEHGIMVGFHTALTADVGLGEWPILPLGEMVIRQATTLDEAIALFRQHPTAAGWIAVVSDAKTGQAVAIELSRHHQEVVAMTDNVLAVSNRYRSQVMQQDEISLNWSAAINFLHRQKRMEQLLAENFGKIDAQKGAEFLSDHWDNNTQRSRATGDVIAQFNNVQSVVVDSTAMNIWLALGPAPVSNNRFVGFNFEDGFNGRFTGLADLHGTWEQDPRAQGLRLFISAEDELYFRDNPAAAVEKLGQALAIDPAEPVYAQVRGLILLRTGKPEAAAKMFEQALDLPQTAPKQSLGHLWLGRSYDLMGRREPAVVEYQKISGLSPQDPRVKAAAEQGLKHPFTRKAAAKISVDFGSGDSYGY